MLMRQGYHLHPGLSSDAVGWAPPAPRPEIPVPSEPMSLSQQIASARSLSPSDLRELHRLMVLSRLIEQACGRLNPRWFPAEGEEAAIVGSFYGLRADDALAPHYRGPFIVYLMRGAELPRLIGQALGKEIGYARGRAVPFTGPADLSIVPWVAGDLGTSLGVATGAGLAFHYEGSDRVAVVSFGDGTVNRGDFHENVNLATCWKLPVVYVCQNNQWAISEPPTPSPAGRWTATTCWPSTRPCGRPSPAPGGAKGRA
jgi:TPP-dependent pyruvate/acetoin dehydrogenase alpha subunit